MRKGNEVRIRREINIRGEKKVENSTNLMKTKLTHLTCFSTKHNEHQIE